MSQFFVSASGGGGGGVVPVAGIFTPVISGEGGDPTTTYSFQNGTYYQLGNQILFNISLQYLTMTGGSGTAHINLPFNTQNLAGQSWVYQGLIVANTIGNLQPQSIVGPNSDLITMFNGNTILDISILEALASDAPISIYISGVYTI